MNNIIVTTDKNRAAYDRFVSYVQGQNPGITANDIVITQTDLRLEALLTTQNNVLRFNPYKGTSDRPLENKLSQNEIFCLTGAAIAITKFDPATGKYANFPLFTYPDRNYFVGAAGGASEAEALECLYQGKLSFKTGSIDRIEGLLTHHMKYVPSNGLVKAAGTQTGDEYPQYGGLTEERGYHDLQPNIVIDGSKDNEFSLTLGQGVVTLIDGSVDGAGAAVTTRNVAVLLIKGFKMSNTVVGGRSNGMQCNI